MASSTKCACLIISSLLVFLLIRICPATFFLSSVLWVITCSVLMFVCTSCVCSANGTYLIFTVERTVLPFQMKSKWADRVFFLVGVIHCFILRMYLYPPPPDSRPSFFLSVYSSVFLAFILSLYERLCVSVGLSLTSPFSLLLFVRILPYPARLARYFQRLSTGRTNFSYGEGWALARSSPATRGFCTRSTLSRCVCVYGVTGYRVWVDSSANTTQLPSTLLSLTLVAATALARSRFRTARPLFVLPKPSCPTNHRLYAMRPHRYSCSLHSCFVCTPYLPSSFMNRFLQGRMPGFVWHVSVFSTLKALALACCSGRGGPLRLQQHRHDRAEACMRYHVNIAMITN